MTPGPTYKIVLRDHNGDLVTLRDGDVLDFKLEAREVGGLTPYQKAKGWLNHMQNIDPETSPEIVHLDPDFLPLDGYNRIQARVKSATELISVEEIIGKGYGDFTPGLCLVMALKEIARIPVKHPGEDHKVYITRAGYYLALVAPRLAEATYRDYQDKILRTAAPRHADAAGQLLTITAHLATLAPKAYVDPRSSYHVADAGYCLTWLGMIPVWDPTSAVSEAEIRSRKGTYTTGSYTVETKLTWDPSAILGVTAEDPEIPGDPQDFKGRI